MDRAEANQKNAEYWAYICGAARRADFGDDFDEWYLKHYSWMEKWIPFDEMSGKVVLEVGIGSGTTARKMAGIAKEMHALDIAAEPLALLERQTTAPVHLMEGSVLDAPYPDATFDHVVSIGCVHHTGDVPRALSEIHRITKPGGGLSLMVYHKGSGKAEERRLWDSHPTTGEGAPFTQWFTVAEVERMLLDTGYSSVAAGIENYRAPRGVNVFAKALR